MSHHSDDYENAAADLGDYYGQPIFYNDPTLESSVEIATATVHKEKSERRKNETGWVVVRTRKVYFDTVEVTAKLNGVVTIEGVTYSIENIGTRSGAQTALYLKRTNAGEISRPGARR